MADTLQRFTDLKAKVDRLAQQRDQLAGKVDAYKAVLSERFGVKDAKSARAKLVKLEAETTKLEAQINEALDNVEATLREAQSTIR